jgi:hypothetical protein
MSVQIGTYLSAQVALVALLVFSPPRQEARLLAHSQAAPLETVTIFIEASTGEK